MTATNPTTDRAATIDRAAVAALAEERLDFRFKAVPPSWWGRTIHDVLGDEPRLSELPTPLVTLSKAGIDRNLATMARWCAERGVAIAPHGKTTMAPALWQAQLDAGAWAITLANVSQLAVARAFGVSRVLLANEVVAPDALRWIAAELQADPDFELLVLADSVRTVELMTSALPADGRPVDVLVELGGLGGRTGARDPDTAVEVAAAVTASPALRLAGVEGYEGPLVHGTAGPSLERVRGFLGELVAVHERLSYPPDVRPVLTAGGSIHFDLVADVLGKQADDATVVIRAGAYLTHDDGEYRDNSPLGLDPRTTGEGLVPAIHGWIRVLSQPEPGHAFGDGGKRDFPFDEGLPEAQLVRSGAALDGVAVGKLMDQHTFLHFSEPAPVEIGDVVRLGLSHPCTAFDKWNLLPMLDDVEADDPVVVDLVRTFF